MMMHAQMKIHGDSLRRRRTRLLRSFTLLELLVVVAIISLLAVITLVSVRAVSRDVRLAGGRNTVTAVLDNARSLAIKRNKIVMVVFRAKPISENEQIIEAITVEYKDSRSIPVGIINPSSSGSAPTVDRYVPIPDAPVREFDPGVAIAIPNYGGSRDSQWLPMSNFPNMRSDDMSDWEDAGVIAAVMFGPDGTPTQSNPATATYTVVSWVDFNNDGLQRQDDTDFNNITSFPAQDYCMLPGGFTQYFCQKLPDDEPYVSITPFLAVYDDVQLREFYGENKWFDSDADGAGTEAEERIRDISEYINANVTPVYFNRYSGVVVK